MDWKRIERIVAAVVLGYALLIYLLTVAPTASFWDSGEFIAIAYKLEVSHPPGAPFYMLVGRLFSMFVPTEYVALAVNLVSVFASAFTILLTHLIIVRLVREWQGKEGSKETPQRIIALAGGVIGACTFAVTDSFWFNAVEAEVYAMSMFFTAAVIWLIMKWSEKARQEEALLSGGQHPFGLQVNRYLVIIAYMFGLAIGVHLLNLLAIFFIALIVFFTEFERPDWPRAKRWQGIALAGVISSASFLLVYPVIIQKLPKWAGDSGMPPLLFLFGVVGLVVAGVYYTQQKRMQVSNLIMLSVLMILIGYSAYALIFIRSASNPPIDENDPETAEAIVSYLAREQYGETPLLKGNTFNNRTGQVDQSRDKYFPRRYSPQPHHWRTYARYQSDFEYFWKYQVGHMYVRYFLWNFVGKESDIQDSRAITGFQFVDGPYEHLLQSPSEKASRNRYYALPLLLGLLGGLFHFHRDWRRAFSVMVLFAVTGIGIIIYLNQYPMQPRERDYSYVASFFAFSLWVGIGAAGIMELVREWFEERRAEGEGTPHAALLGLAALLFVAVPGWMLIENYDDHDRSGRYVAPEYAYNMLMSVEQDGIVFTNGDNDTFPLWYLQEVEEERQDIRVVNLSLLNTPWYVRQLKNQYSRSSAPLPISMNESDIDRLSIIQWQPSEIELPVNKDQLVRSSEVYIAEEDIGQIESPMRWTLQGRPFSQDFYVLYGADIAALDILRTNAEQGWKRPVYFAVTVSPDGQLDLQNYFQLEGQAFRVVPIRHNEPLGRVVPSITTERLSKFKFTNLNDPSVYYDENIRRMVDNYRNIYAQAAEKLTEIGRSGESIALLDTLMEKVPFETIPGDERSYLLLARAYQGAGEMERTVEIMQKLEPLVFHRLANLRSQNDEEYVAQFVQMIRFTYLDARNYEAAASFDNRLADVLGDDGFRVSPEDLQREYEGVTEDSAQVSPEGPQEGE